MNPFLFYFMANFTPKYTKFVCLIDCHNGQKNYSTNDLFTFKQGVIYGTNHTPWFPRQNNQIYTEKETYDYFSSGSFKGTVSAEFLAQYFVPLDEYKKNIQELNDLFETFTA